MIKDPTKTLTIRRRAAIEVRRKFNALKKVIIETALTPEAGLIVNVTRAVDGRFVFLREAEKVEEFNRWLQEQIDEEILFIEAGGEVEDHWLNTHIGEGYERGASKTRMAMERSIPSLTKLPDYSPLANPSHAERAELIFTRAYDDLTGVTNAMSSQISRELSGGMIRGESPKKIARAMADRVDKIGRTRAQLIARTEIVESHNSASIQEARNLAKETGEKIDMQWWTTLDGKERDEHFDRHEKIYSKDEAENLIGDPNCRCSISAYVDLKKM